MLTRNLAASADRLPVRHPESHPEGRRLLAEAVCDQAERVPGQQIVAGPDPRPIRGRALAGSGLRSRVKPTANDRGGPYRFRIVFVSAAVSKLYHVPILDLVARNPRLASARRREGLSQEALAIRIQQTGYRLGHPNVCNRANVARWENGGRPQPHYVKLLEATLGQPAAELGLAYVTHGMDRDRMLAEAGLDTEAPIPEQSAGYSYGPLSGIWLSRYEIYSSSRDGNFAYQHYVQVLQRGAYLNVRSLPKQHSRLALDLSVNGRMIRGTWAEHTSQGGYYGGTAYDGSIMLELNAGGTRMKGRWLGFGRDPGEINDGPWQFTLVDGGIERAIREKWDIVPEE